MEKDSEVTVDQQEMPTPQQSCTDAYNHGEDMFAEQEEPNASDTE